jgi:hypothetical protein
VTWSVKESGGGKIDAQGKYVSPATAGSYTVVATAKDGSTATATVNVVPLGVTMLAGQPGGKGNIDGPASHAHFNQPSAAVFDYQPTAQLFIADTENHTIRKYDQNAQKVTTIAGLAGVSGVADGVGSAARFNRPQGITFTGKTLFVSDTDNHCIRTVDLNTGNVTTLSGVCGTVSGPVDASTGAASRWDQPRSMTVNSSQQALYVCELGGNRSIRRVDLQTGGTTTAVTNLNSCDLGQPDFQQPYPIYYTDGLNPSKLHSFVEGMPPSYTATVNTLADLPYTFSDGVATADAYGNDHWVYLSFQRSAIYRYDLTTQMFEGAPALGQMGMYGYTDGVGAAARFQQISGLVGAFAMSKLYVIDGGLSAIREVDENTMAVTTKIGAPDIADRIDGPQNVARFTVPAGLAADEKGTLYIGDVVVDQGPPNNTLRMRDPSTGAVSTLAGMPKDPISPAADGVGASAAFGTPFDVVYDGTDLYVLDAIANAIRKVTKDGHVTTIAGQLGVPGNSDGFGMGAHFSFGLMQAPSFGMATDHKGNLYVSDGGNYAIRKIILSTGEVKTIAGGTMGSQNGTGPTAQFMAPAGLTVDGNTLYIADALDHTIRQMDLTTFEVSAFVGITGNSGYKDGDVSTAQFQTPFRVLADGIGNLYVTELGEKGEGDIGTIRRIDIASRTTSTFAGTRGLLGLAPGPLTTATLNGPLALALMPNGDLAFGDITDHAIAVIGAL